MSMVMMVGGQPEGFALISYMAELSDSDFPKCHTPHILAAPKKKRRRRRRRRRRPKTAPIRQRQLSTTSDDFVCFADSDANDSIASSPSKKVRFAPEETLCVVHKMIQWSFAYQAARKGHWEECVRDRARFKRRIYEAGARIGPVLRPEHRARIYSERFCDESE